MLHIDISETDILSAICKIIHDPDPGVRKKMLVIVLKALGIAHGVIAFLVKVHINTVTNHLHRFNEGGLEAVAADGRHGPKSGLCGFEEQVRAAFEKEEPSNSAQAAAKLRVITDRWVSYRTAVRWMKALGMRFLRPMSIPSKADHEKQSDFLNTTLLPLLRLALVDRCKVFFMDAAHFVQGSSLGPRWAFKRGEVRASSGRRRHNVLAALDPIAKQIAAVTEVAYVNAQTVIALLRKLRAAHKGRVIWLVLDNAAYQKCDAVTQAAADLRINLLYLPPYSPNLNLIERLWRLARKRVIQNKYYEKFSGYRDAIDNFIEDINKGLFAEDMESLITLKFQLFANSQIAVA